LTKGREEGIEEGLTKGLEEGLTKGAEKKKGEFITSLLEDKAFSIEKIARLAKVGVDYVEAIAKELQNLALPAGYRTLIRRHQRRYLA
jgi:flagellar biosynthesis/type III secretory pathway protein FliH